MPSIRAEFTVLPFMGGPDLPLHVRAAIDALRRAGLEPEVGPFGTAVVGEAKPVLQALILAEEAAIEAGATRVVTSVSVECLPPDGAVQMGRALEQLVAAAEAHVGRPIAEMSRIDKQEVVRYLDQRGAFELRRAVEMVADALGVSRFTVYNYLESFRRS